jgi:hypothetical protein
MSRSKTPHPPIEDPLRGRSYARVVAVPIAAAAAVCLVLLALTWPTLTAKPRQVPVAVAGQPQLLQQVSAAVTRSAPDAITVVTVTDRDAAVRAIRARDVVGAVVLQPPKVEVLTASAAGSGPTEVMQRLAGALRSRLAAGPPAAGTPTVVITDVVPLSAEDPSGTRLMAAGLPLAVGGVLAGALLGVALVGVPLRRPGVPIVGLLGCALITGFSLAAILHFWYGALTGDYWVTALMMSTAVLAVASIVVGLRRLMGLRGVGVGAVLFILGSVPISGALVPREFLPTFWSDLGQLLPQGAAITLLRDLSYFPDAPIGAAWWVLAAWAVAGLILTGLPLRRSQRDVVQATTTASTAAAR